MKLSCLIIISVWCLIIPIVFLQNPQVQLDTADLCTPPNVCVPFNQCLANGTINEYGVALYNPKFSVIRFSDNKKLTYSSIELRNGDIAKVCESLEKCCTPPLTTDEPEPDDEGVSKGCGIRNPSGIQFEIVTTDTSLSQFGEFPWTVALIRINPPQNNPVLTCGGSLIHPSVVLTAAHCVNRINKQIFRLRAGEWDTSTEKENIAHQERNIAEIILHENFHDPTSIHDIALVILDQPFILRSSVQTICLPTSVLSSDGEQSCFATGWGATVFASKALRRTIMKKVELPVVPRATCQAQLRKTRLGKYYRVHDSLMCAGGNGQDTCTGDGGSPLVCPYRDENNRYYQTGIVATGIGCAQQDVPGLYVDVARHRDWIDEQMSLKNFPTNSYVP